MNNYSSIFTADDPADYTIPYELMVIEANPSTYITPWYNEPGPGSNDAYHAVDVSEATDSTTPALKFWNTALGRTTASGLNIHAVSSQGYAMTFTLGSGAMTESPAIGTTLSSLTNATDYGTNAPTQIFAVYNKGGGTLTYTLADDASWLSLNVASGTATTEADLVTVNYHTAGSASDTYSASITISDSNALNSPQTIPVDLTVHDQPVISLDTHQLGKNLVVGGTGTSRFVVRNTGGGTLRYELSESLSWLDLSVGTATLGAEEDHVAVTFDASNLLEGTYQGTITARSTTATIPEQSIDVVLNVSGHILLMAPQDGASLWPGNLMDIKWKSYVNVPGDVKIELFRAGALSATIAQTTANDGLYRWAIPDDQVLDSSYKVRITSVANNTVFGENVSPFTITAPPASVGIPYSESFESGLGNWAQSPNDDFDWTVDSGGTPSSSTGPSGASEGSFYIYTEASSPNSPGKTATLRTFLDLRSTLSPLLSFDYNMYGSSMGTLEVRATSDQKSRTQHFSKSGNQGTAWQNGHADLSALAGKIVEIQFTGTTGSSYSSDMAVDRISLSEATRRLSHSTEVLTESPNDDGSIDTVLVISLSGETFTGTAVSAGHVQVANVPAGLSALIVKDTDTQITITLNGNATDHGQKDTVSDLEVSFADGAFTGGDALAVGGNRKSVIVHYLSALATDIDVTGNGISIADGDSSPTTADHTDFGGAIAGGASVTRSFTILNHGWNTLELTGTPPVEITGADAADFSVTAAPATSISPTTNTTFQVTFDPATMGPKTAVIQIDNNDTDENPYDFAIQGTGTQAPPVLAILSPATDVSVAKSVTSVAFSGTASITVGSVDKVEYRVNNAATWSATTGTTSWSFTATNLSIGANTIDVRAQDDSGAFSTVATRTVTRDAESCVVIGKVARLMRNVTDGYSYLYVTPRTKGIPGYGYYFKSTGHQNVLSDLMALPKAKKKLSVRIEGSKACPTAGTPWRYGGEVRAQQIYGLY